jgi:hypothetical protein
VEYARYQSNQGSAEEAKSDVTEYIAPVFEMDAEDHGYEYWIRSMVSTVQTPKKFKF